MFSSPTKCHLKSRLRRTRKQGNKGNREQWSHDLVQGMVYGHTAWGIFVLKPHYQTFPCLHTSLFLHMISCNMSVLQAGAHSQNAPCSAPVSLVAVGPLQGLLAGSEAHCCNIWRYMRMPSESKVNIASLRVWFFYEPEAAAMVRRGWACEAIGSAFPELELGMKVWVCRLHSPGCTESITHQSSSPTFRVLSTVKPQFWPQESS